MCIRDRLGLVLQKKPIGTVVSGTMKTILGFLVLSAGSSVIQGSLAIFGDLFNKAFGLKGLVASIEGINGQAMTDLGLGSEIAITSVSYTHLRAHETDSYLVCRLLLEKKKKKYKKK